MIGVKMKLSTCHPNRKVQARGLCKRCYDKWLKSINPEYKQKQISNTTKWAKQNPERMNQIQLRRKEKDKLDSNAKSKKRNGWLKRKYGIDQNIYDQMLNNQNGECAICTRKPGKNKNLHVDHDHKTNKVRGLFVPSVQLVFRHFRCRCFYFI